MCGFTDPDQDNWLITQHINRTLPGGDRLEQVEVTIEYQFFTCTSGQCSAFFNVYAYDTSTINPAVARVVGNFGTMPVNVVTPTDQSGGVQNKTFSLTYSSTDTDGGFYLAIRDQNSCLIISRVLVFYYVCPAEAQNLVQFEELLAPPNIPQNEAISVLAQCVPNASPVSQTGQVMVICDERGLWQVIPGSGCECDSGMQPNNDGSECIGETSLLTNNLLRVIFAPYLIIVVCTDSLLLLDSTFSLSPSPLPLPFLSPTPTPPPSPQAALLASILPRTPSACHVPTTPTRPMSTSRRVRACLHSSGQPVMTQEESALVSGHVVWPCCR